MAKLAFTKLGLSKNQEVKIVEFNGQDIEVKQYLPVNEKFEVISNIINHSADDNNFANPIKINVFTVLEIINFYTNISFTEKQREDPAKLYDLIISNNLAKTITGAIPQVELDELMSGIKDSVEAIYKYKNSAMGIMEAISTDYSNLDFNASEIQSKLADPENMNFLKDVLSKLG